MFNMDNVFDWKNRSALVVYVEKVLNRINKFGLNYPQIETMMTKKQC